jgi:hypothetical protein
MKHGDLHLGKVLKDAHGCKFQSHIWLGIAVAFVIVKSGLALQVALVI